MSDLRTTEKSSFSVSLNFKDDAGAVVTQADIGELKLRLYDLETGNIINSRDSVNVDGVAGGSWLADVFTMTLDPADNVIVSTGKSEEIHILQFWFSWNGGLKSRYQELKLVVDNLAKVT